MMKLSNIYPVLLVVLLAGCGPSDATINSNVKQQLGADDTVKSATLSTNTQNKVVTLSGAVESEAVKERAVSVARQTSGVSDVFDQITVKQAQFPGPGMGRGMMNGQGHGDMPHGDGTGKHQ